ncbi:antibiotic biosynthesis monooxygenase family protein [Clostridium drakei]|uniref:Antibiotic biosynthesis monooxygenase n=1 Tax=Clostridium drakei TaxID=332101 RepID=A0A2U8DL64_9CLOT|nr:antibiotic biosynthesis monooxygenase [Clostridium drakei]AWI03436.1 antibiotic biosynthesis monooxygenase [Clostridium drakei]
MNKIIETPKTPYYAVIFTSIRTSIDNEYEKVSDNLVDIVSKQKGFLGVESVRNEEGFGVTISYWDSLDSINEWKDNNSHMKAKEMGKKMWYSKYMIRICKVEKDNYFDNNF